MKATELKQEFLNQKHNDLLVDIYEDESLVPYQNERVGKICAALDNDDFDTFKALIQESENSSYKFLQNVFAAYDPQNQAVSIGLAMSEILLGNKGVCRVHGGGFAGTIQAFVENDHVAAYKEGIEKVFGEGSCHILKVRKYGGYKVLG